MLPQPEGSKKMQGSFEQKFVRYKEGQKFEGIVNNNWTDTAWKNDRLHKQIILWSNTVFTHLTYESSDLINGDAKIPAANIRLRFGTYVMGDLQTQDCGKQTQRTTIQQADALSEIPVTVLTADDVIKIWITIDVPATAVAGNYTGKISIKSEGKEQLTFNINLLVTNKILPDVKDWSFHLDLWQYPLQYITLCRNADGSRIVPFSETHFKLIQPFYQLLADAGQSAITTYIKDGAFLSGQTMVKWKKNNDDSWSFDFTDFNNYVSKMMSWGITKQINAFSLIGWNTETGYYDAKTGTNKTIQLDVTNAEFATVWNEFLTAFKNNLLVKGWFNKTVLYMDEIEEEKMQKVITVIKKNHSDWEIGVAGRYLSAATEQSLYDYSTVWGYNRSSVNQVSTFYTSCSQFFPNSYVSLQNNPAEMPFMAWYAAAKGYHGYLRWAYDYWTNSLPFDIRDGSNTAGDYSMIYRTDNSSNAQPISSMRMELLREGIQDYEKLKILNHAQINALLPQFAAATGSNAGLLVSQAEALIKKVSVQ